MEAVSAHQSHTLALDEQHPCLVEVDEEIAQRSGEKDKKDIKR